MKLPGEPGGGSLDGFGAAPLGRDSGEASLFQQGDSVPTRLASIPGELHAQMAATNQPDAPKAKKRVRAPFVMPGWVKTAALAIVAIGVLGGGIGLAVTVPYKDTTPALAAVDAFKEMAGLGMNEIVARQVRGTVWRLSDGHRVLVVIGEVENRSETDAAAVLVRAELRDHKGQVLQHEEVFAGKALSELDVASLTADDWDARYKELSMRLAEGGLTPGGRWPFSLLVLDPADTLRRGEVRMTAHRADPPHAKVGKKKPAHPDPELEAAPSAPAQEAAAAPPAAPAAATKAPAPPPPPPVDTAGQGAEERKPKAESRERKRRKGRKSGGASGGS